MSEALIFLLKLILPLLFVLVLLVAIAGVILAMVCLWPASMQVFGMGLIFGIVLLVVLGLKR